jgi:hypothetical protein
MASSVKKIKPIAFSAHIPIVDIARIFKLSLGVLFFVFFTVISASADEEVVDGKDNQKSLEMLYLEQAEESLESNKPLLALRQVSYISLSPQLKKLALSIASSSLELLSNKITTSSEEPEDVQFLLSPEVRELMLRVCLKDQSKKPVVANLFSWYLMSLLKANDLPSAKEIYQDITLLTNDLVLLNELRYEIAMKADTAEEMSFARQLIDEIRKTRSLTVGEHLGLFTSGYYSALPIFIILFLFFIVMVLLFGFRIAQNVLRSNLVRSKLPGNRLPGYRTVQEEDEYSRMLKVFGLSEDATDEEIKNRYRELVKSYHPDTVGPASDENITNFRELKKAYERILEMKKHRFGG